MSKDTRITGQIHAGVGDEISNLFFTSGAEHPHKMGSVSGVTTTCEEDVANAAHMAACWNAVEHHCGGDPGLLRNMVEALAVIDHWLGEEMSEIEEKGTDKHQTHALDVQRHHMITKSIMRRLVKG